MGIWHSRHATSLRGNRFYRRPERSHCFGLSLFRQSSLKYRYPEVFEIDSHPLDHKNLDRKSTRLNSSHSQISYAVFCLKKKNKYIDCYSICLVLWLLMLLLCCSCNWPRLCCTPRPA